MRQFRKGDHGDLVAALGTISPAALSDEEWRSVCAGWKASGLDYETFDVWCQRDPTRYDEKENRKRWDSFKPKGNANGTVSAGTVARIIEAHGGTIPRYSNGRGHALKSETCLRSTRQPTTTPPISKADEISADPCEQMAIAVRRLFKQDELVNIITEATPKKNDPHKWNPKGWGKCYKAEELVQKLNTHLGEGDAGLEAVIGSYNHEAGVWWRANPTDGNGTTDENVTRLDHVLLEADEGNISDQLAIIDSLGIPVSYVAFSGNHSVHAIVNVDAGTNAELYEERVITLYEVAKAHGLKVDEGCRSRSKLSRAVGALRNGKVQKLLRVGKANTGWKDWRENLHQFIGSTQPEEMGLPHATGLLDVWTDPPQRPPVLIGDEERGLLRRGHVAVLSGPSKAGKSWACLELCVSVATGTRWMGYPCKQGRCLYVNFELDARSVTWRLKEVARACAVHMSGGQSPEDFGRQVATNVSILNLRGVAASTDEYTAHIITETRALGNIDLVCVDPLRGFNDSDENSNGEMKHVMADLLQITTETGASVITIHHHAKGKAGSKQAMDRGSGAGVIASAPDAVINLSPLEPPEGEADALDGATAWRLEAVLREFPPITPVDVLFKHPRHYVEATGTCSAWQVAGADPYADGRRAKKRREAEERTARADLMRDAFNKCLAEQATETVSGIFGATVTAIWERMGKDPTSGRRPTRRSVSNWADEDWSPIERVNVSDNGKPRYLFKLASTDDGDEED
nr:AAA family ATPase [Olegusella massiliensis]